jgi:hypothetical protein
MQLQSLIMKNAKTFCLGPYLSPSSSLYELPLPYAYSRGFSAPTTPITPSFAATSSYTPMNTPSEANFPFHAEANQQSLRHRPLHLMQPVPRHDVESLVPTPEPRTPRIITNYMCEATSCHRIPSPKWDKLPSFFSRSVDAVAGTIEKYTADGGGEEGLLLPISQREREIAEIEFL